MFHSVLMGCPRLCKVKGACGAGQQLIAWGEKERTIEGLEIISTWKSS